MLLALVAACSRLAPTPTEVAPVEDEDPEVRQEREEALAHAALLADPKEHLVIGSHCYATGQPPRGRHELDALVRMNRVDALRKLLRAPTAEGRVYAAIGLRRCGAMSKDELVAFLSTIDGKVHVCAGCMVLEVTPPAAVPYYSDLDEPGL
ncbi:MAG: hypothetical protein QM784_18775 [Polyangiaceae bacterium]